jgi:hypothetical protein
VPSATIFGKINPNNKLLTGDLPLKKFKSLVKITFAYFFLMEDTAQSKPSILVFRGIAI